MFPFRPFLFSIVSLLLLLLASSVTANVGQAPDRNGVPKTVKITIPTEIPEGYVSYDIPPISVQFRSVNTLSGDPEKDAAQLQSELANPLKNVVGLFIKDSFEIEIAKLLKNEADTTPPLIFDFVSLDFQVTIRHQFIHDAQRRRLNSPGDGGMWYLDFYSDFVGRAYFIQPEDGDAGGSLLPTHDYMHDLMLGWINHYVADTSDIVASFENSNTPLLANIESLKITTDTTAPYPPNGSHNNNSGEEDSESARSKWGRVIFASLVVFCCVALVVVGALLFRYSLPYIVPYFQDHSIDATHNKGPLATVFPIHHYRNRSTAETHQDKTISPNRGCDGDVEPGRNDPLPGRRGDADEEMIIRQQNDQWLKENRPDLYEAVQRSTTSSAGSNHAHPFDEQGNSHSSSKKRNSQPMQFLLGGLFKMRKGNPTQEVLPQSSEEFRISDDHDLQASFSEGLGPMEGGAPNWWNMVVQGLTGSRLACEEDPSNYNFAFQDFPRHDGTPCLIYSENGDGSSQVVRTENGTADMSRPLSPSDPLSNDEFKRVLSLNGADDAFSLDEKLEEEEFEDEIIISSPLPKSQQFTDKLERLVAMRLRHYERQNLLEKHKKTREQREQEESRQRVQEESRQRELKLRRHEMELDMNEIEGRLAPRSIARRDRQTSGGTMPSSNSPTDAPRGDPMRQSSAPTMEVRKSHRITASDPDFCSISSISSNGSFSLSERPQGKRIPAHIPTTSRKSDSHLNSRTSVPRHDSGRMTTIDTSPPAESLRDVIYPTPTAVASKHLQKSKIGRQRSHRRCSSYGTDSADVIKKSPSVDCLDDSRRRISSGREDVMTFGIAAYTDFV